MRDELLEIEPGFLLDVAPIHSDEIVTFAGKERKWRKRVASMSEEKRKFVCSTTSERDENNKNVV